MEDIRLERFYSIDALKCISIFIVVYFHTVTFNAVENINTSIWFLAFPRFIIPYFFIVSGFLFGEKIKNSLKKVDYFKAYTLSLIKLFGGWYIFYLIYEFVIGVVFTIIRGNSLKAQFVNFIKSLPNFSVLYYGSGDTAYHLWFLTALIWSIVILFIFIKFKKQSFLLLISFILNLLGLFGQSYSGIFHLPLDTTDALFFGLFYVTAGWYISSHYEKIKKIITRVKSITLCYLFLLSCTLQIAESLITFKLLDGTEGGIGYYLSTIPLTISLIMLVLKNKNFGQDTILIRLGRNTFGIYVTHMLFISLSYLTIHFFDLEELRTNKVFNLFLTLIIFVLSHYFYLITQNYREKINLLIFKEIPKIFKMMIMRKAKI